MIEVVTFTKAGGGALTKRISLEADGHLRSDGSACIMTAGEARRAPFSSMADFAAHIACLNPIEAIALGRLNADLPDTVLLTTKAKLNGGDPAVIARTSAYIGYRKAEPALLLLDFDTKGMPEATRHRLTAMGGFAAALCEIVPGFGDAGQVIRRSTSAGLYRTDTGEPLVGSDGLHLYVLIADGADAERALRALHDRCLLAGLGWFIVGAAGQLLERSIVDRMVSAPERLVFEGAPVLEPPLAQDTESRRPKVREGVPLDTKTAIPKISIPDQARLARLKTEASRQFESECREVRSAFITRQTERLTNQGVIPDMARRAVERLTCGVLRPDVILPFDLPEFAGHTAADVLADPERFVGATLADPVEGIEYGICKARVVQRADGSLWIRRQLRPWAHNL